MDKFLIADFIVVIHFIIVIFNVGMLFVILIGRVLQWNFIRNFWLRIIHLVMIIIVVFEAIAGISCPLTDWEYELRIAAGQRNVNEGSFVARLVHQLIFYDFPPIVFTIGYCLFGIAVLVTLWLIPPHLPKKKNKN